MILRTGAEIAKEIIRRRVLDDPGVFDDMVSIWEGRKKPESPESDQLTDAIQTIVDDEFRYLSRAEKAAAGAQALDDRTVKEGDLWGATESEIGGALISDLIHETVSRACYDKTVEGVTIDGEYTDKSVDARIQTIADRTAGRGMRI